jgi:hypothetical protein
MTKKRNALAVTADILKPSMTLLIKLGSIAVHTDEILSVKGHEFDRSALVSLLVDPEVVAWVNDATTVGLLPVKR